MHGQEIYEGQWSDGRYIGFGREIEFDGEVWEWRDDYWFKNNTYRI